MSQQPASIRTCLTLLGYLLATSWVAIPNVATAEDREGESDQAARAASLLRIRDKAGEFTVARLATPDERPKLCAAPLLRYSDPSNGYRDAAVWAWEIDGFPIALAKVEDSRKIWQYCVASLAPDEILVSRPGQQAWKSKGPGITFQEIPAAPRAVESPSGRLRSMKSLARRFGGRFQLGANGESEQMRPLPRPIHRFSAPNMGLIDGAIFVFAVSGTNPTALVVITLRDDGGNPKTRHWDYGVVGMTADSASIYLDDRIVWSKKANYKKKFYENWYFHQQPK